MVKMFRLIADIDTARLVGNNTVDSNKKSLINPFRFGLCEPKKTFKMI
jgi:hypothetical protein